MRRKTVALLLVLVSASAFGEVRPTLEELLSLRSASAPQISPDGKSIAFTAPAALTADDKDGKWRSGGAKVFDGDPYIRCRRCARPR